MFGSKILRKIRQNTTPRAYINLKQSGTLQDVKSVIHKPTKDIVMAAVVLFRSPTTAPDEDEYHKVQCKRKKFL